MRNLAKPLHTLTHHAEEVFQVQWCPHAETILASCGADRRVMLWDLARVGDEQTGEEAADGPPELLFIHGGHTAKVSDLAWSWEEEFVLASTAEDNILMLSAPAKEIFS